MLVVESIANIRRDHFVHSKSIKAIGPARDIARNTVCKVLLCSETEFRYEQHSQPLL